MVEYVKLTNTHREILIEVLQLVVDYKHRSLTPGNWSEFESRYLPKAIEAVSDNKFKVVDPHNGIIPWLIDNIIHSKRVVAGIPKRDWIPLVDLDLVQECLSFLRHAQRGQTSYTTNTAQNTYGNLFD
jgi:hypothetical protein